MLTKDYYPLSPALDAAFKDADLLVEEADLAEMLSPDSQLKLLMRGMLPENQSLQKVLSPSTYTDVSKRLSDLGMPIEPLQRFKPWLLALTIMSIGWQKAGFDPAARPRQALLRPRAGRGQTDPGPRNGGLPDLAFRSDDDGSAGPHAVGIAQRARRRAERTSPSSPTRGEKATHPPSSESCSRA